MSAWPYLHKARPRRPHTSTLWFPYDTATTFSHLPCLASLTPSFQVIRAILSSYENAVFAVVCTGWDGCAASLRNRLGVGSDVIVAFEPLGDTPRDRAQADAIEWSILGQTALILASPANSVALTASAGLSVPVVEVG